MKLQTEDLKGKWVSIASGTEGGLRDYMDALFAIGFCARITDKGMVVDQKLCEDHDWEEPKEQA